MLSIKIYAGPLLVENIDNDYIDISTGSWNRKSIAMPSAFQATKEQQHLLADHSDWLALPLPNRLISAIKKLISKKYLPLSLGELCFNRDVYNDSVNNISGKLSEFLKPLWTNSSKLYRRITPASVRAVLFEKITEQFDGGYATLMLANSEYDEPTTLYYLGAKAARLIKDYVQVVNNLGFELGSYAFINEQNQNVIIGSQLTINKEKIINIIKLKRKILLQSVTQLPSDVEEIIKQHEQFVCYTLLMFLAATGHRSRTELGFTSCSIDTKNGYILVSDKINFVDSSIRVIPMAEMLKKQLLSYKHHCVELARLIKPYSADLAVKLSKVFKLVINDEPSFFYISKSQEISPIGYDDIETYLQPEVNLPLNFLRHNFCSTMRNLDQYHYAKAMMGHVGSGEHLLSDHSCAALGDVQLVASVIEQNLKNMGFEFVEYAIPKGPKVELDTREIKKAYCPAYMQRLENKERSAQIRWARQLVIPFISKLQMPDIFEQTLAEIYQKAGENHDCGITIERRFYWLNRILKKISSKGHWLSSTDEPQLLSLEVEFLSSMRQANFIKNKLNTWLLADNYNLTSQEQLAKVWLSLVINSAMTVPLNLSNLLVIVNRPYHEQGIAWFDIQVADNNRVKSVIIDSVSLLLLQKFSIIDLNVQLKSAVKIKSFILEKVLGLLSNSKELDHRAKTALKHIDKLGKYLSIARDARTSSLVHAYQNERITTTDLIPAKLYRWLAPELIRYKKASALPTIEPIFSTAMFNNAESNNFSSALALIRQLNRTLNRLHGKNIAKLSITKMLISSWADFINVPDETDVEKLIALSSHLEEIIILVVLWLIDVSKRPGRGKRKRTALGTIITYLSNIAKPLLEQSWCGRTFLTMDSEELIEFYTDALDSRNLKDRAQRAENMRNFHNFIMKNYLCSPVDWYAIEPSIGRNDQAVDANIISMREYEKALALLANDQNMKLIERNINQLILIFCYRAGLRSGETTHLKIGDIDTDNWIIHIRTHAHYRTKTLKSNRRIPVGSLLSYEEKSLILNQIKLVKQYHCGIENLWFFSDKISSRCVVQVANHISRVIQALRLASGDNSLRLHHARHSFANYLLLIMTNLSYTPSVYHELKKWSRVDNLDVFSQSIITQLTGKKAPKGVLCPSPRN